MLDHLLVGRFVRHGPEHFVRGIGSGLDPLTGQDGVGNPYQSSGHPAERDERHEQADHRSGGQGRPLRMLHGPGLGRQLGDHKYDDDFECGGDDDTEAAERVSGDHADECRRDEGAQLESEEHDR